MPPAHCKRQPAGPPSGAQDRWAETSDGSRRHLEPKDPCPGRWDPERPGSRARYQSRSPGPEPGAQGSQQGRRQEDSRAPSPGTLGGGMKAEEGPLTGGQGGHSLGKSSFMTAGSSISFYLADLYGIISYLEGNKEPYNSQNELLRMYGMRPPLLRLKDSVSSGSEKSQVLTTAAEAPRPTASSMAPPPRTAPPTMSSSRPAPLHGSGPPPPHLAPSHWLATQHTLPGALPSLPCAHSGLFGRKAFSASPERPHRSHPSPLLSRYPGTFPHSLQHPQRSGDLGIPSPR